MVLIQEAFGGDEYLEDVLVDFVVSVHPCIVRTYCELSVALSLFHFWEVVEEFFLKTNSAQVGVFFSARRCFP